VAPSKQLAALIFSLEEADSPFERMHQLGLAWRSIRELSRQERLELARHAGFDGAEELVERLAARSGGLAPAVLLEAIESARQADPSKLKALFAGLRDPARRGQVLADTLRAVGRAAAERLAGEDAEEGEGGKAADARQPAESDANIELPESESESESESEAEADVEAAAPLAPEQAETLESLPEIPHPATCAEPTEAPAATPASPEAPLVLLHRGPGVSHLEAAGEVPETVGAGDGGKVPRSGAEAGAGKGEAGRVDTTVDREEVSGSAVASDAAKRAGEIAGEPRLLARLLRLRQAAAGGLADPDLGQLLAGFPPGWPRRRALSALIEGGSVSSAALALDLVAELGLERDRGWCLALVLRTWDLSVAELDRALALVSSPARRRRLLGLASLSS